jgi:hypothetical protein
MLLTLAISASTNGPRNWQMQTAAHATKSLSSPARTGCQKILALHITYGHSSLSKALLLVWLLGQRTASRRPSSLSSSSARSRSCVALSDAQKLNSLLVCLHMFHMAAYPYAKLGIQLDAATDNCIMFINDLHFDDMTTKFYGAD